MPYSSSCNGAKGRVVQMMWSNRAFGIYMGDVIAHERDAQRERDLKVAAIAREHQIERMVACEPEIATDTQRWVVANRAARTRRTVAGAARS